MIELLPLRLVKYKQYVLKYNFDIFTTDTLTEIFDYVKVRVLD